MLPVFRCLAASATILLAALGTKAQTRGNPVPSGFQTIASSWKASSLNTFCTGERDSRDQPWQGVEFDDSSWSAITLPDQDSVPVGSNRLYRGRFALDRTDLPVSLHIVSDDGVMVYVNGGLLGGFITSNSLDVCSSYGCINIATCLYNRDVSPVAIPQAMLRTGINTIAVQLHNGGVWSYLDLRVLTPATSGQSVSCLPQKQLCTPDHAEVKGTSPGRYHVILPANLEWGASVANLLREPTTISAATGRICWDPMFRSSYGCNGPEGSGVTPGGQLGLPEQFLAPNQPAGALIAKLENGRTYFSVNDRSGKAFDDNEGYFEFDVDLPTGTSGFGQRELWVYSADLATARPGPALADMKGYIIVVEKIRRTQSTPKFQYKITVLTESVELNSVLLKVLLHKDVDVLGSSLEVSRNRNGTGGVLLRNILNDRSDEDWEPIPNVSAEETAFLNALFSGAGLIPKTTGLSGKDGLSYLVQYYLSNCKTVSPSEDFKKKIPNPEGWARADATNFNVQSFVAAGLSSRVEAGLDPYHVYGVRFAMVIDESGIRDLPEKQPAFFIEARAASAAGFLEIPEPFPGLLGLEIKAADRRATAQRPSLPICTLR